MLKVVYQGLCDLIYPPRCLLCQNGLLRTSEHVHLCAACLQQIEFNRPPFCRKCSAACTSTDKDNLCRRCRGRHLSFDRAWSICQYNDALRHLIHLFKYGQKLGLRHDFTQWILDFTKSYQIDLLSYDALVPIPLHTARMRERGYNQAQLIADTLARSLNIPVNTHIQRCRNTPYQARCSQKQRWTNISGAFKIKHSGLFKERSILIVDDLMTTGATISEVARSLKEAGAYRVDALTLAAAELN